MADPNIRTVEEPKDRRKRRCSKRGKGAAKEPALLKRMPMPSTRNNPNPHPRSRYAVAKSITQASATKETRRALGTVSVGVKFPCAGVLGQYLLPARKTDNLPSQTVYIVDWTPICLPLWMLELYREVGYELDSPLEPLGEGWLTAEDYDAPCEVCGGTEPIPGGHPGSEHIACDGCDTVWHGRCLSPPLHGTPMESW
jgi:hypothetical protein